jgi:DNA-binding NtrC family response regulator
MAARRMLLIDGAGSHRDALARALTCEGHEVRVADSADQRDRVNDFAPDVVVYREGLSRGPDEGDTARWVALTRPVNMEELRRVLRV